MLKTVDQIAHFLSQRLLHLLGSLRTKSSQIFAWWSIFRIFRIFGRRRRRQHATTFLFMILPPLLGIPGRLRLLACLSQPLSWELGRNGIPVGVLTEHIPLGIVGRRRRPIFRLRSADRTAADIYFVILEAVAPWSNDHHVKQAAAEFEFTRFTIWEIFWIVVVRQTVGTISEVFFVVSCNMFLWSLIAHAPQAFDAELGCLRITVLVGVPSGWTVASSSNYCDLGSGWECLESVLYYLVKKPLVIVVCLIPQSKRKVDLLEYSVVGM